MDAEGLLGFVRTQMACRRVRVSGGCRSCANTVMISGTLAGGHGARYTAAVTSSLDAVAPPPRRLRACFSPNFLVRTYKRLSAKCKVAASLLEIEDHVAT